VHLLNADLHCHSTASDGSLSPSELARRAHEGGVQLWSLTDHDELAGQREARAAAESLGIAYVSGVEISVSFAGETVHILGFGFDPDDPALNEGLARLRAGRTTRAQEMGESLAKAGIPGAYEGALALAPNPELVSRTHFARFLVEHGHCSSVHEVFSRFLKEGKPGFVEHRWAGLGEALRWVHGAGGVTAIAHPARYRFTPTVEFALFSEFQGHGGRGVEVTCGSHYPDEIARYADTALEFDLLASRGSDFHAPGESRVPLGQLPDLPGKVDALWSVWADTLSGRRAPRAGQPGALAADAIVA
jgi:predicted metal-dependent phosphoesterase TrpH